MAKRLLLLPLLCCTLTTSAQFNLQFHYDLGRHLSPNAEPNRQLFTVTAEFFKPDRLGSTFLFIDMDYRGQGPQNQGAMSAYWEMSRDFTFAKVKDSNSSFTAHIEYDGGLNNYKSFQQSVLLGPAWGWHNNDFSKTFTFQTLYKQFFKAGDCKALPSFQTTAVWAINFAKGLCTFSGYADLWYGYIPEFDVNGVQKKGLVFLSEPQFWFNVFGRNRKNNRLSVGTEFELSNNFIWANTTRTFYLNPTLAVKYTF
ncbi:MAG: DUF5020 family protein [Bacteroidaceae bacterium]|nr:DUF5020 family protein [Bacteroidaceae bacterium]